MKYIILFLLLGLSKTNFCSAQKPKEDDDDKSKSGSTDKGPKKYPIEIISNDTCNLMINGVSRETINGQKTIKLPFGTYQLLFESLETGETIRHRSLRFNKDSLSAGRYTYRITFKE